MLATKCETSADCHTEKIPQSPRLPAAQTPQAQKKDTSTNLQHATAYPCGHHVSSDSIANFLIQLHLLLRTHPHSEQWLRYIATLTPQSAVQYTGKEHAEAPSVRRNCPDQAAKVLFHIVDHHEIDPKTI